MIHWKLTEQQADQVLTALGHRPFLEVNGLIGTLLQQAQEQQKQAQYEAQVKEQQAQQAQLTPQVQTQVYDRPFEAAESNRIGDAAAAGQAINGIDRV